MVYGIFTYMDGLIFYGFHVGKHIYIYISDMDQSYGISFFMMFRTEWWPMEISRMVIDGDPWLFERVF